MRSVRFLFLVIFACFGLPLQAAVYKWVDENGKTHYGDRPTQNAEKVRGIGGGTGSAPNKAGQPAPESTAGGVDVAQKVRAQKCTLAKERLAQYQQAGELYTQDEFGNKTALSPEEQVQTIVNMQSQVDAFCTEEKAE